jgi:hypothetical protein
VSWIEAANQLEAWLEEAARLIDGEEVPGFDMPGPFDLSDTPDRATRLRVEGLLADADEAMTTLSLRKAEITQELEQANRLRKAGTGYLRF